MTPILVAAALLAQASREPAEDTGLLVRKLFTSHLALARRMESCGLRPDWAKALVWNSTTDGSTAVQVPVMGENLGAIASWRLTPENSDRSRIAFTWTPLDDSARRIEQPERGAAASAWSRCLAKDLPPNG